MTWIFVFHTIAWTILLQIKFFSNFDQYKFRACLDVFQCHWTQKSHYTEKLLLSSSLEIC